MKTSAKRILADLDRDWAKDAPFDIRPARTSAQSSDHGAVCKLFVSACREYQWLMSPAAYMVYVTDLLDLESRLASSQLLLGEFREQLVGTITCESAVAAGRPPWPATFAGVRGLAVAPEYRGQGVGAALLEECMGRAKGFGAAAIGVHVAEFMTGAIGFYERFGFERAPAFDYDAGKAYDANVGRIGRDDRLPLRAYVARLR